MAERIQRSGEKIIKIGPYLPKLSQKDCVGVLFWLTVYNVLLAKENVWYSSRLLSPILNCV